MSAKMWPFAEEEILLAVEVGVEEHRAPTHAYERRGGKPGPLGGVLELAAVNVAIDRVPIAGERRQDQIDSRVAVVVARVRAERCVRFPHTAARLCSPT